MESVTAINSIGTLARNCPGPPSSKNAAEARGRSTTGTTTSSHTSTVESNIKPDKLTEKHLEASADYSASRPYSLTVPMLLAVSLLPKKTVKLLDLLLH